MRPLKDAEKKKNGTSEGGSPNRRKEKRRIRRCALRKNEKRKNVVSEGGSPEPPNGASEVRPPKKTKNRCEKIVVRRAALLSSRIKSAHQEMLPPKDTEKKNGASEGGSPEPPNKTAL